MNTDVATITPDTLGKMKKKKTALLSSAKVPSKPKKKTGYSSLKQLAEARTNG